MNPIEEKLAIIRETSQQLAALAKQRYSLDDPKNASEAERGKTACLLSGGNIDTYKLTKILH